MYIRLTYCFDKIIIMFSNCMCCSCLGVCGVGANDNPFPNSSSSCWLRPTELRLCTVKVVSEVGEGLGIKKIYSFLFR